MKKRVVLEGASDAALCGRHGRRPPERLTVEYDLSRTRLVDAVDDVKQWLFPAPFGPMSAQISPLATEKLSSKRALTPRNERETSRTSSMGALIALPREQQARGG
jgi:hypothetical protein